MPEDVYFFYWYLSDAEQISQRPKKISESRKKNENIKKIVKIQAFTIAQMKKTEKLTRE